MFELFDFSGIIGDGFLNRIVLFKLEPLQRVAQMLRSLVELLNFTADIRDCGLYRRLPLVLLTFDLGAQRYDGIAQMAYFRLDFE